MVKSSAELHALYQSVYGRGRGDHFLKYRDGRVLGEAHERTLARLSESGAPLASILDFGCGEADFLARIPASARRIGVDFSQNALSNARAKYPDLELVCGTEAALDAYGGEMDVVCSFGTLEHMDDPKAILENLIGCARPGGLVIVSCPSFLNVRGVIWMALVKLFNVPMSLSDRHFLTLQDFREMAAELKAALIEAFSVELSIGQGTDFGRDMRKRLTNALRDANLDNSNVETTVSWFERNMTDFASGDLTGAETVYVLRRNDS